MFKKRKSLTIPTNEQIKTEIKRVRFNSRYYKLLRSTIYALVVTAAFSVLVATFFLPVLQIYGTSMAPTLNEGEIVISIKRGEYERGDIIAMYYSNKVLVKRIIATGGDVVELSEDGTFTVNGEDLEEPYINDKAYGEMTNITFPYVVPEKTYFVVGDNRSASIDSRNTQVGCVEPSEVVGKIVFKIWPVKQLGTV